MTHNAATPMPPDGGSPAQPTRNRSFLSNFLLWIMIISLFTVVTLTTLIVLKYAVGTGVRAFSMSNQPGSQLYPQQFDGKIEVERTDMVHIQMLYIPERVSKATVRLVKAGKDTYRSGDYELGAGRHFSLSLSAMTFESGEYTLIIENQDRQTIARGTVIVQ